MTSEWTGEAARGVLTLFQGVSAGLSDAELLRRFVARDEASGSAFEVLVARHGPAVWGVCRRTLADPADALDAFQATFLILVQKAGSVRVEDSLGPWLHGVSTRVARRARANLARRRGRETSSAEALDRAVIEPEPFDDLRAVLDHELARLPARYRSPLILCYLEGLTHEEAATRLSCPVGTVRSRLARGRGLLQSRLVRKGFAPSVVATALAFETRPALAALASSLIASTVKLALGRTPVGPITAALAADFSRSILMAKLGRIAAALLICLVTAGIAAGWMVNQPTREADDAPLPVLTVEQLSLKIDEAQWSFGKGLIEAEFEEEKATNMLRMMSDKFEEIPRPPGLPERPKRKARELAKPKYEKAPGRSSFATDGLRWKATLAEVIVGFGNPPPPELPQPYSRWVAGYDGTTHYKGDGSLSSVTICEHAGQANEMTSSALFWQDKNDHKSILDEIMVPGAKITQKTVDGFRCYVVQTPGEAGREAVISPRQSYLPLSMTRTVDGEAELATKLLDLQKLPDGRWYPGRTIVEKRFKPAGSGKMILESRRETRIVKFEPDHVFKPEDFALEIRWNADVYDWRTGLFYRNDRWWPEIRDFLRKEYDWPRADVTSLDGLTSPDPALEGRDAPPLWAARWLRGGPVSWETLRGKVVLIVFPDPGEVAMIPALRRLKEAYGKDVFEVVEVMQSRASGDWAAGYLAEYDVDHPVLLDTPLEGQYGKTSAAFGVGHGFEPRMIEPNDRRPNRVPAYLVDPLGKIHAIAEGGWSKAVVDQLQLAGLKTAKLLTPSDNLGGFDRRYFRLQNAWKDWAKTAPASARIVGKVVDRDGKPVAGAQLRCRLFASVLGGWKRILDLQGAQFVEARTGADGSFVIEGRCKGTYRIDFAAPGLATTLREVVIGPDLGDVPSRLVLAQGDTVTGLILDEAGQPIAGARAVLSGRHYDKGADGTAYQAELAKTAIADAAGRFRFEGLWEGRYSLQVSAEGRASQTREEVPAGVSGLEFQLK